MNAPPGATWMAWPPAWLNWWRATLRGRRRMQGRQSRARCPRCPPPPPDVAASYEARAEYEAVAAQIQSTCDAIALLDRAHGLRVAAIQTEYAAFMERVRALAQAAIDEANASFQATRHGVTVHLDALVALFQARFYAGAPAAGSGGRAAVAGRRRRPPPRARRPRHRPPLTGGRCRAPWRPVQTCWQPTWRGRPAAAASL